MADESGLVINYYGPGSFQGKVRDGTGVHIRCNSDYPQSDAVTVVIEPDRPGLFGVRFRIPAWSLQTCASLNGESLRGLQSGQYLEVRRHWTQGDTVRFEFDMSLRFVPGDREAIGKVSVYRGPLLLAYDQRYNPFDEEAIPPLHLHRLREAKKVTTIATDGLTTILRPWVLIEVPTSTDQVLRLCDFASAGASGTRYRSWLVAQNCPPAPAITRLPRDGAVIPGGPTLF
jgi:DUF1680 family protein